MAWNEAFSHGKAEGNAVYTLKGGFGTQNPRISGDSQVDSCLPSIQAEKRLNLRECREYFLLITESASGLMEPVPIGPILGWQAVKLEVHMERRVIADQNSPM